MEKTLSDFLEFTPLSARTFCQNMQAAVTGISPFHVGMSADDIRVDIIYYIDANISLPNHITKGNYIICTSDYSSMNKFESPSNIIYISDEDEYLAFIHKISTILADENRLSHISARILSMLQNGYSVQKILEYGFELLGNPLMVSDASFCYIAGVHLDDIDEPVWNYVAEK
ncbi:MAG: hypothetical protein MJ127_04985, partial [Mogibacterium sp.]|nr:hypothetical protein [Mogibacterium sp.]